MSVQFSYIDLNVTLAFTELNNEYTAAQQQCVTNLVFKRTSGRVNVQRVLNAANLPCKEHHLERCVLQRLHQLHQTQTASRM